MASRHVGMTRGDDCDGNNRKRWRNPIQHAFSCPRPRFESAPPRRIGSLASVVAIDDAVLGLSELTPNEIEGPCSSACPPAVGEQNYCQLQGQCDDGVLKHLSVQRHCRATDIVDDYCRIVPAFHPVKAVATVAPDGSVAVTPGLKVTPWREVAPEILQLDVK